MRTPLLCRVILLISAALMFCLSVIPAYGQNDPSKEIMVYFTTGVERGPENQPVRISSLSVKNILAYFKINQNQVTSAFPKFNEADTFKETQDGRLIGLPNMAKIFKVQVHEGIKRETVIDSLKKIPGVLFAEPNGRASFDVIPNDQFFSYQWVLQAGGGPGKIQAPEAWDIYKGSSSSIIGIIDRGVDGTHPDLSGKVSGDAPNTVEHGTHVAGIATAKTNNTAGVVGVDWNSQVLSKNIENSDDAGTYQKIVSAVNYSSNVNVLNNSWKLINNDGTPGRYSTTVRMAFAYAYKQNRVAVATMGNTGNTTNTVQYPGSFGQGIVYLFRFY